MSKILKNPTKNYIILGVSIAVIFLILDFIPFNYYIFSPFAIIFLTGHILALLSLIIALIKIINKSFTTYGYETIKILLIVAIISVSISLISFDILFKVIVLVICIVVLGFTYKIKKEEEAGLQEDISVAQREYDKQLIKFVVGLALITIGIFGVIIGLSGLGGLGVSLSGLSSFSGMLLLGILTGIPIITLILPGYILIRSAYRKYSLLKQ